MGNLTQLAPHPISIRTSLLHSSRIALRSHHYLCNSIRSLDIGIANYNKQQCSLLALPPLSPSAPLSGLSPKLVLSPRPCLAVRNPAVIRGNTCRDMRQLDFRSQLNGRGDLCDVKVCCLRTGQLTDVFCAVDNKLNVPGKIIPYEGSHAFLSPSILIYYARSVKEAV
jgi:hypothetical protein